MTQQDLFTLPTPSMPAGVRLYNGDCLDILPTLASVDAVITDPPFGTGKLETGGASYRVKPTKAVFGWDRWDKTWMNLVVTSCMAIFTPPGVLAEMLIGNRLLCAVTKQGVCVKNVSPMYRVQPIVLIGKTPINYERDWFEYGNSGRRKYHPVQKSLELMKWLVKLCSNPGDTILDPFMGSGTTGVACVQTKRSFIGIEIDPDYYTIAEKRIAGAQPQPSMW